LHGGNALPDVALLIEDRHENGNVNSIIQRRIHGFPLPGFGADALNERTRIHPEALQIRPNTTEYLNEPQGS
jgi:hypothetical protein